MPELPEVETIARQLALVLPGKIIASIDVLREKSFHLQGLTLQVVGKRIEKVERKQKMVVMKLSNELILLVHLKMTGQLIFEDETTHLPKGSLPPLKREGTFDGRIVGGHPTADWIGKLPSKHTRVVIRFTDKSTLYFNDQRVFGWIKVVPSDWWLVVSEKMAPDVIDEEFSVNYLTKVLEKSGRAVKLVILDQDKIGGMGNIYANDALYLAGILPNKKANSIKKSEVVRLHKAMKKVIEKGIETGGASYSHFMDIKGVGGHYQEHFLVYNKEGERCRGVAVSECDGIIQKISIGGRGTYFCSKCQR
jgi:formamidopyrimidine-DNA glycosylase